MPHLIDKAKVAAILQVAIGYDPVEFDVFIDEAEKFDLRPLMCDSFYYDLMATPTDEPYTILISGGSYQYDGRMIPFGGIAEVLARFAYARYFLNSPNVATSHGIVVKTTPNSTPVPLEDRRNTYYKKREEAGMIWADVQKYIERQGVGTFPSWNCDSRCNPSPRTSPKTIVIQ